MSNNPGFIKVLSAFLLRIITKFNFDIFFQRFKKDIKKPDVLFSNDLFSWREFMHINGESYEDDIHLESVIKKSKETFNKIACLDIDTHHVIRSYSETKNKFSKTDAWVCFEQFITYKNIFLAFYLTIKKLSGDEIDKIFESYLKTSNSPYYRDIFNLLTSDRIIKKIQPKAVFLSCEYGDFHRALTHIANKEKIFVFALQHGVLNPKGYMLNQEKEPKRILPNITFVYGQHDYETLINKSIYKPEQIIVSGQPRNDVLFYANKNYSKEDFLKRYNIPLENKIVLWTTQFDVFSEEETEKSLKTVINSIKKIKKVALIIKQHPTEDEKITNLIKSYIKDDEISALLVPKKSDIYEQLFICDLMITKFSTTAMEAVTLNKPVIVLNLSGKPDLANFVEEGIALGVYNEKEFIPTVEKLLKNNKLLEENRNKYIKKYLYKMDGKATERVVKEIKRRINNISNRNT